MGPGARKGEGWRPQQEKTKDSALASAHETYFDKLVRNVHKVLLTPGMHGVCLHSVDRETNDFLQRMSQQKPTFTLSRGREATSLPSVSSSATWTRSILAHGTDA